MFKYPLHQVDPKLEPDWPHVDEKIEPRPLPTEGEIRYLGNAYNYCSPLIESLQQCMEEGVRSNDEYLYKRCKGRLEDTHHCFSWREPTESSPAFMEETKPCLVERDMFVKCYFKQAGQWEECELSFNSLYRCLYLKKPSVYNIY
jgi:hypothetical protein